MALEIYFPKETKRIRISSNIVGSLKKETRKVTAYNETLLEIDSREFYLDKWNLGEILIVIANHSACKEGE